LEQHRNRQELELYLSYRGIQVVGEDIENNLLFYSLRIPCSQLGPDNECKVHNMPEKPLICYHYPWEKDDIPECSYEFEPASSQIASYNDKGI
jgi:hypothetical protein